MCEHFLACCFPCCYVFSKRGCGSECCVNFLLNWLCYLPAVCHACTFIGTERDGGGGKQVIVQNTITHNAQQPQPMMVQMAPAPGHYYGHGQQPMVIQTQPGASPAPYFAPQQPQIHQFHPEAPPMYSPAK